MIVPNTGKQEIHDKKTGIRARRKGKKEEGGRKRNQECIIRYSASSIQHTVPESRNRGLSSVDLPSVPGWFLLPDHGNP
jgi:hypothetical protein